MYFSSTRYIAHRGNTNGRDPTRENTPAYIDQALKDGFDVEIDVWVINGDIYLGHDGPETSIGLDFLELRKDNLWCHAKNLDALCMLVDKEYHCFSHDTDNYILTSRGFIWAFPGQDLNEKTICVMPERAQYSDKDLQSCVAICSDLVCPLRAKFGENIPVSQDE